MKCSNTDNDEDLNALRDEVDSLEATLSSPYYRELRTTASKEEISRRQKGVARRWGVAE